MKLWKLGANGDVATEETAVVLPNQFYINIEDEDNRIYHITRSGSISLEIPTLAANRVLTFEVIVDFDASTSLNFLAFIDGNEVNVIWLDTPDFAQGAGKYFCAFRYYAPVGLMGNLYWKQDEESSSSAELAK